MIVFPSALCWNTDNQLHFYWSHILCLWKFTSLVLIQFQSLAKTIWHESYKCTSVHRWYSTNTNDIFFVVKFWIPSLLLQASSKVAVGIFLFHISLLNAVSSWKHFHNDIKHQIFRLFSSSLSGYFKWVWRSFLLGDMSLVDVREPICPGTPYIGRLAVNYVALDIPLYIEISL